jgi:SpoVK/Ycf46/Vps4 family AAA+-type ATPase
MTIQLVGPPGTGKSMIARAIANELGRVMIQVDCGTLNGLTADFVQTVDALVTEARVQGAILVFDRCEPLFAKGNPRLPPVLHELERFGGLAILTTSRPEEMDPGVEQFVVWQMDMGLPEMKERQTIWELHVPEEADLGEDVDLEDLATRFEMTGGQVRNAWAVAVRRAEALQGVGPGDKVQRPVIDQGILRRAAQAQIRANMEDYSVRSKVELTMDALVLPPETHVLIDEVLQACKNRVFVMSKWGFGRRLVTGKGICVLFKGEPGTGKTFCSEILASALGMKLYQVSIPKIVSKYIGETEKNISKIFHSARASHSMLLFDEADSLFTKRVSVESAIDRHSNMETNLLLQEIERFEGITILTTNLDKNMDDAFARRIQFKINFPFPDDTHRALIWKRLIPAECPIADDIDFDELGANFELSGGHIKNAVVRAAYRAAARDGAITYDDVEFAAEQECKNAGKLFRTSSRSDDW